MTKIYLKNKRLPECCNYVIDRETGDIKHEAHCPEKFLQDALIVIVCIFVCVLILAAGYFWGN